VNKYKLLHSYFRNVVDAFSSWYHKFVYGLGSGVTTIYVYGNGVNLIGLTSLGH
jgi:hypothetical protein